MALRYLGTWAEVATGLGTENPDRNDTDTADRMTSLTAFRVGTETISRYPSYGTDAYAYAYDNIGNRLTAQEAEEQTAYTANNLNQYTAIQEGEAEAFVPTYDADGNQTLVKTSTGIWTVTYNAANRPVVFANEATGTVVECSYDSSGRRATKKVTVNGTVTLHQRYIYRGYLQIACCDLTRTAHPCLWLITWDPTQPIATRPLAIQKDGTWYTYGFDLTKNVMEVFGSDGYIKTAYTYTPYGAISASGNVTQPIRWSSEVYDEVTSLTYYNWRYYNSMKGRWNSRDIFPGLNLYHYINNQASTAFDILGLIPKDSVKMSLNDLIKRQNRVYPVPKGIKADRCVYFIFYDWDKKGTCFYRGWHKCEDNNYISHVAVYTLDRVEAVGFNPSKKIQGGGSARILKEDRKDIVLIKRCCDQKGDIDSVRSYLALSLHGYNAKYYYQVGQNGEYKKGSWWHVNGPNCATFAWNVSALYFGFDKKVDWDYAFLYLGTAHRPEEFRQFLQNKEEGRGKYCQTIYTDETGKWKGKE